MAIKVLFHSNGNGKHCPDGFAAAYAMWKCFGDKAEYIPCVYQQSPPEIQGSDEIFLVDFSYPRDVLEAWADVVYVDGSLVVLDHHKTAQESLSGGIRGADIQFDMNRSGAQLAWGYFEGQPPEPDLISYVADRDLWKKELPHTEEVHRALMTFPQDFEVWDTLANLPNYVDFMRRIGEPIYQKHLAEVEELAASAEWKEVAGHKVLCTNTINYSLVSDALNLICERHPEAPFAVNYAWKPQKDNEPFRYERMKLELRSIGDFDVSAIAKELGGGGHRNAAGCEVVAGDGRVASLMSRK